MEAWDVPYAAPEPARKRAIAAPRPVRRVGSADILVRFDDWTSDSNKNINAVVRRRVDSDPKQAACMQHAVLSVL